MKTTHNGVLYLLNPKANDGGAGGNWSKVVQKYPQLKDSLDITKIKNLSSFIEKEAPEVIAIAGGDGTINSVTNAIFPLRKKPLLTIFPMGTGNALAYCFGVETIDKAMDVLLHHRERIAIDVMETNIPNYKIGVFNISVGFDARVVHTHTNYRYIGLRSYIISGIVSLIIHPEKEMTFTIDHEVTFRATACSLMIANCPIIGQNYVVSQEAKVNDGVLDCTLFSTKYDYFANLRLRGFRHPLYSELGKTYFKAKHIRIAGEPFIQIDGDPVTEKNDIDIEIVPRTIAFLRNDKKHIDQRYLPFIA